MPLLAVAPMMDWTDIHCRFFFRMFTRRAVLFTEMVTTGALLRGDAARFLRHHAEERPVVLQLGGSDPADVGRAARAGIEAGFDGIDLNVGCPSDRVQSGCFGAALMRSPQLVADCAAAMVEAAGADRVSVKCRIGVDDQDPEVVLPLFLETVSVAGVKSFAIHARKAWLQGLSPKENREVPPLDHDLVVRMKAAFPHLRIAINGGITSLDEAEGFLARGLDGVMIGRAAYHGPAMLGAVDRRIFGEDGPDVTPEAAVAEMLPYIEAEMTKGVRLHQITRHMLGAFHGRPGARAWRRALSETAHLKGAGPETVEAALALVEVRDAA